MSEETTERLNDGGSFETRVLTALAAINGQLGSINIRLTALEEKVGAIDARLIAVEAKVGAIEVGLTSLEQKVDALEEKVDSRLRETRPIREVVLERLKVMYAKFDAFALDLFETRAEIIVIKKRVPPAA